MTSRHHCKKIVNCSEPLDETHKSILVASKCCLLDLTKNRDTFCCCFSWSSYDCCVSAVDTIGGPLLSNCFLYNFPPNIRKIDDSKRGGTQIVHIWYLKHWSIFEDVKRISQWFCDCESISYLKWENIRKSAKEACFETYFWEISPKYGFFSTSYLTVVTYKSIFTATKIQVITLLVPSLMPGKSISHLGCNFALVSRFTAWEKDLELLYKCRICKWQYISCNKMQATFPSANRCIIPWQMRM